MFGLPAPLTPSQVRAQMMAQLLLDRTPTVDAAAVVVASDEEHYNAEGYERRQQLVMALYLQA